ncbi:MAG TPA: ROK family protein [Terracidiphilus sp.]|nr:ROK family protein [Terracidiphilus sp.]
MTALRFSFTNTASASNRTPRQINRNLVFNQIRTQAPISRADLARASGLQRSTVSLIVEELLAERWIVEGPMGRLPRGRRPTYLNLNSERGVLALDVHPSHAMLGIVDLGGRILEQCRIELPDSPQRVVGQIVRTVRRMLGTHRERKIDGIGMSLPARFDLGSGNSFFAPNIRWPIRDIRQRVAEATGLPVTVDNVANACALAEIWFGNSDGEHDLVVVNVSEGIGTGIFANGRILRGEGGYAGEFGHVQLDPKGPMCACGNRGCWETLASNRAGLRYFKEIARRPAADFETLLGLAAEGDRAAKRAVAKMCAALGRGMRMVSSALAPMEIVVVGDITTRWELVGPGIEAELRRGPMARVPRVRAAAEGGKARLRSAVALVMNEKRL